MTLDALPSHRAVHVVAGSLAVVDLYLRNQVNAALLQAAVASWSFRVYSEQSASPETVLYSELAKANTAANADTSVIVLAAAAVTGASRLAIGHTFLHKFDPLVLFSASDGRLYTLEYTFVLTSTGGPLVVRVPLAVGASYQ